MRWILIIGLLLIVSGCVDPVIPPELQAVLDDPAFSEVAEVVHEGNLDGLRGCWGSYFETDAVVDTYVEFVEFGDVWRHMMRFSSGSIKMVLIREGTYTVEDEHTVRVIIDQEWGSDPITGELIPAGGEDPTSWDYEVSLQGDRMTFFPAGEESEKSAGEAEQFRTLWRFSECP